MDPDQQTASEKRRITELAATMARDILDKPDHGRHEYVGVVYRDPQGHLAVTPLATNAEMMAAPLGEAIRAAGAGQVVAVVHNHPRAIVDAATNREAALAINQLPSNNDWKSLDRAFPGRTDVTYFIVGPDEKLRGFEAADREDWDRRNEFKHWDRNPRRFEAGPELPIPEHGSRSPAQASPDNATAALAEPLLMVQARERLKASHQFDDLDGADHDRLAAALAVAAFMQGMQRIEQVLAGHPLAQGATAAGDPGGGLMVFAVQGRTSEPGHLRSQVAMEEALKTPVETSLARMAAHEAALRVPPGATSAPVAIRLDPPVRSGP